MPDLAIVVGSHGALRAFELLMSRLPDGFPAAVILDLHHNSRHGFLPRVLARSANLPVLTAIDGLSLDPGKIYLAPPDRSLLVGHGGFVRVSGNDVGIPWHRFADMLISGAAQTFGKRLIAIVLSGQLDAGALGVRAVKMHGGRVLVQDPASAAAPSMPRAALGTGCADFALPPESLGDALVALCAAPGAAELFRVDIARATKTSRGGAAKLSVSQ
jgi:two-component system chemotaxis response regulator CheB